MKCCILGRVSALDSYNNAGTGEVVGSLSVASGKVMVNVRTPDFDAFSEDDLVVVSGTAIVSPKGFFFKDAVVRSANDYDKGYFAGVDCGAISIAVNSLGRPVSDGQDDTLFNK